MRRYISDFSTTRKTNIEGLPLFDICRNRHRGNTNSIKANQRVTPLKQSTKARILDLLVGCTTLTLADISKILNKPVHTISGRLSELKKEGRIVEVGVINGYATYRRAA